jgi:hypothetical protein
MSTEISIKNLRHALSPTEQKITTNLPEEFRYFVQLRQEKPVSNLSSYDIKAFCHDVISRGFIDFLGGQTEALILTSQTNSLMEEFAKNKKFQQLTVSEVREAFRKGIRGLYGPFFGMCARTYHLFLASFLEEENRAQAWMRYQELLEKTAQSEEVTPEQKIEQSKQALLNLFEEYKATGSLGICPWAYCGVLADLIGTEVEYAPGKTYKTFIHDPEVRKALNEIAEKEFEKENKSEPAKTSIYDFEDRVQKKVTAGDAIMRSVVQAGLKKEEALANKKKEVALRWYFDQLIKENRELEF